MTEPIDFLKKKRELGRKKRLLEEIDRYISSWPEDTNDKIETALKDYGSFRDKDNDF